MNAQTWLQLRAAATRNKPTATLEEHKAILASLIAKLPPPKYARGQGCAYIGGYPTHQPTKGKTDEQDGSCSK